jgi:hypothetical protein
MTGQREYHLSNALVNNDLVFSMGMNFTELENSHSKYANEFVAYVIFENAFRDITTGNPTPYTVDIHRAANYVANPRIGDSFA